MLFILFRGREYAIQMVPWACMCYANCSVGAHITIQIVSWGRCTIQIVPWAYICYYCSVGVPVQFKLYLCVRLFYSNCSVGVPMYYSDCSVCVHMLFKLFCGRTSAIQIVPLCAPVLFQLFRGRAYVLFRLFHGRTYAIQIVLWACLCNSNCTFVRTCFIQIVP